uniref:Uncharacterized protein n=1 Tax=Tetranychus urticae TaxID=32264 RepID=T1K228_TETUR
MSKDEPQIFNIANKTRPTRWDKRILTMYKVYPTQQEIPDFVSRNTITFYRNKFRVHYSIATMALIGLAFFGTSYAGNRFLKIKNERVLLEYYAQQKELENKKST